MNDVYRHHTVQVYEMPYGIGMKHEHEHKM